MSVPGPGDNPCPMWPADLQDQRACAVCPLERCLYSAVPGRPITKRGELARTLLHLETTEVVRLTGISRRPIGCHHAPCGCDLHRGCCLDCPFPRCKYDVVVDDRAPLKGHPVGKQVRNKAVAEVFRQAGRSLGQRSVLRILQATRGG